LSRVEIRDQAGRKFLGADAFTLGWNVGRHATLPSELNINRLQILRNPSTVDAGE